MNIGKINKDINEEFNKITKNIVNFFLSKKTINLQILSEFLSRQIDEKTKLLTENLENYLMEEAKNKLKNQDIEIQNKFFEKDFRSKINQWFQMETLTHDFQIPKLSKFLILLFDKLEKAMPSSDIFAGPKETIRDQKEQEIERKINKHLNENKTFFKQSVKKVIEKFNNEFYEFCKENNINWEKNNDK